MQWLRSRVALVSQTPVLFPTSIYDNIALGKDDATREEVEAAARMANAHDFISAFPDGYNTMVGDSGAQLSGGQVRTGRQGKAETMMRVYMSALLSIQIEIDGTHTRNRALPFLIFFMHY